VVVDDSKWEKLAALGGGAFVLLNVASSIVQGAPPASDDTNDEVLKWVVDNDSGIKAAGLLGALSIIGLVWWFGTLWRRMSAAEHARHRLSVVALIGLVGSGGLFAASLAVLSTLAIQVDDVGPDSAKFFIVFANVLLSVAGAFLVTHLASVSALGLRTGFIPKWVSMAGLLAAVLFLVSTIGTTTDADVVMFAGFAGFIVWMVWIVGISVHMWRTAEV
jgi:hypothetical protein